MKYLCLLWLMISGGFAARAQTDAPEPETLTITSPSEFQFDMKKNVAIYRDQVRVDDPQMKLTCEWLVANLPQKDNPDRHILATTNVVIDLAGDKNSVTGTNQAWHVTCDRAVYDFHLVGTVTNETVTLSGHAVAKSDQMTVRGEPLVYNLATKLFMGTGYTMSFNHTAFKLNATNSAHGRTNSAPIH